MKLDLPLELWYAWKEGQADRLLSVFDQLLEGSEQTVTARLPSASWVYYTSHSRQDIILTIMLCNTWILYSDGQKMTFTRDKGPPEKSGYVNFFYNKCFINVVN